jgi:hypothetical protein
MGERSATHHLIRQFYFPKKDSLPNPWFHATTKLVDKI